MNPHLQSAIDSEICEIARKASNFTDRHTIFLRLLLKFTNYLGMKLCDIPDTKTHIYMDDCMRQLIVQCWNGKTSSLEHDEEMEKLIAKDFIKPSEMARFVVMLQRRESKQAVPMMHKIYRFLGVDGFMGSTDLKRYVEYLKYPSNDFRGIHVRAVRELYDKMPNPDIEKIFGILKTAFGFQESESVQDNEWVNFYTNYVDERLVNENFATILEWKHTQLQEESKRKETLAGKKRKSGDKSNEKTQDDVQPKKKSRKMANPVKKMSVKESTPDEQEPSSSESEMETENSQNPKDESET